MHPGTCGLDQRRQLCPWVQMDDVALEPAAVQFLDVHQQLVLGAAVAEAGDDVQIRSFAVVGRLVPSMSMRPGLAAAFRGQIEAASDRGLDHSGPQRRPQLELRDPALGPDRLRGAARRSSWAAIVAIGARHGRPSLKSRRKRRAPMLLHARLASSSCHCTPSRGSAYRSSDAQGTRTRAGRSLRSESRPQRPGGLALGTGERGAEGVGEVRHFLLGEALQIRTFSVISRNLRLGQRRQPGMGGGMPDRDQRVAAETAQFLRLQHLLIEQERHTRSCAIARDSAAMRASSASTQRVRPMRAATFSASVRVLRLP